MTIFIAAFSLNGDPLRADLDRHLAQALAPAGVARIAGRGGLRVAHLDLGLWPGASLAQSGRGSALVAGDPVWVDPQGIALPRRTAIEHLAERATADDLMPLRQVEGTCCGLTFDATGRHLVGFTDKLGVRPLYWARSGAVLYVASAQWLLEGLPTIALEPDWLGAAETACFGFPLADRTLYLGIKTLPPGSALVAGDGELSVRCYWDWAALPANPLQGDALVRQVRDAFDAAVAVRLTGQKHVMAFLSGGLDSRLIAARLRAAGTQVSSLNFAPPGSQDLMLGRAAAEALGTQHQEFALGADSFAQRQHDAIEQWREARPDRAAWPESPGLVWSGDGGSVALGHVYLSEASVAAARSEGGIPAAARAISEHNCFGLTPHLFARDWQHLSQAHLRGIEADMASRPNVEPGRNAHLFFMLNDQHRHLTGHFERLHLSGFDLVLPFFDGRFLATVLSSRIDPFLRHGLYNELMASLGGPISRVPWQSYPGHHPSPVPVDSGLRKQWGEGWHDAATERRQRRDFLRGSLRGLTSTAFPGEVLNRPKLLASVASGMVGVGGFSYLVENAVPFLRASSRQRRAAA